VVEEEMVRLGDERFEADRRREERSLREAMI
jgi:hypothetical protein